MKKILSISLLCCCWLSGSTQWLKTSGHNIVDDKNRNIILRGMGLGGWMLQEGYMLRLSFLGQQYRIKEKITDVVGQAKTAQFYTAWLQNHTAKADIDSLAAWGFNAVRLPMHYNLYTLPVEREPEKDHQTWLEKGFALTDSLLNWCKANKMYLILDLHAAPGGQGNDLPISDRDPSKPSLWQSEANLTKTIALWRKIAERYANEPWIGAYDIINEPNWGFEDPQKDFRGTAEKKNEPLKSLMVAITAAIREVDKKHMIIIEGNGFGNNYQGILPQWDDNMVLSFHKYGNFNTTASIKGFLNLRDQYNIPLWLGESGENSNTWFREAIKLAEDNGIGWAWWQHKKMGLNNPLEIKRPEGYDELLAYWSGKANKPSETSAWKVLQELLQNIKIEENIYHPDVVDAMIRQVQFNTAKPFKQHFIGKTGYRLNAVDYDMGPQQIAYYDTDTARYQYTPGVNTEGNKGYAYRNDGVDIQKTENGYCIFNIEDNEWLQYTVTAEEAGEYSLIVFAAAEKTGSILTVAVADKRIKDELEIPVTIGMHQWQAVPAGNIYLHKGDNIIRLIAIKGGFNLDHIQFTKKNN